MNELKATQNDIHENGILSADDWRFIYGKLKITKIPSGIYEKLECGDDFTLEEEKQIKEIIEKEKPKKPIEIVGYGMMCPTCNLKYLKMKTPRCEKCDQKLVW